MSGKDVSRFLFALDAVAYAPGLKLPELIQEPEDVQALLLEARRKDLFRMRLFFPEQTLDLSDRSEEEQRLADLASVFKDEERFKEKLHSLSASDRADIEFMVEAAPVKFFESVTQLMMQHSTDTSTNTVLVNALFNHLETRELVLKLLKDQPQDYPYQVLARAKEMAKGLTLSEALRTMCYLIFPRVVCRWLGVLPPVTFRKEDLTRIEAAFDQQVTGMTKGRSPQESALQTPQIQPLKGVTPEGDGDGALPSGEETPEEDPPTDLEEELNQLEQENSQLREALALLQEEAARQQTQQALTLAEQAARFELLRTQERLAQQELRTLEQALLAQKAQQEAQAETAHALAQAQQGTVRQQTQEIEGLREQLATQETYSREALLRLGGKHEEVVQRLQGDNDRLVAEKSELTRRQEEMGAQLTEIKQKNAVLTAAVDTKQREFDAQGVELAALKATHERLTTTSERQIRESRAELEAQMEKYRVLNAEKEALNARLETAQRALAQAQQEHGQNEGRLSSEVAELRHANSELAAEKETLRLRVEALTAELTANKQQAESSSQALEAQIAERQRALAAAEAELSTLRSAQGDQAEAIQQQIAALTQRFEANTGALNQKNQALSAQLAEAQRLAQAARSTLQQEASTHVSVVRQLQAVSSQNDAHAERVRELTAELSAQQDQIRQAAAAFQAQLASKHEAAEGLQRQLAAATSELSGLRTTQAEQQLRFEESLRQLKANFEAKAQEMTKTHQTLIAEKDAIDARFAALSQQHVQHGEQHRRAIAAVKHENATLAEQVKLQQATLETTTSALKEAQAAVAQKEEDIGLLTEEIKVLDRDSKQLEATTSETIRQLKAERDALAQTFERQIAVLRETVQKRGIDTIGGLSFSLKEDEANEADVDGVDKAHEADADGVDKAHEAKTTPFSEQRLKKIDGTPTVWEVYNVINQAVKVKKEKKQSQQAHAQAEANKKAQIMCSIVMHNRGISPTIDFEVMLQRFEGLFEGFPSGNTAGPSAFSNAWPDISGQNEVFQRALRIFKQFTDIGNLGELRTISMQALIPQFIRIVSSIGSQNVTAEAYLDAWDVISNALKIQSRLTDEQKGLRKALVKAAIAKETIQMRLQPLEEKLQVLNPLLSANVFSAAELSGMSTRLGALFGAGTEEESILKNFCQLEFRQLTRFRLCIETIKHTLTDPEKAAYQEIWKLVSEHMTTQDVESICAQLILLMTPTLTIPQAMTVFAAYPVDFSGFAGNFLEDLSSERPPERLRRERRRTARFFETPDTGDRRVSSQVGCSLDDSPAQSSKPGSESRRTSSQPGRRSSQVGVWPEEESSRHSSVIGLASERNTPASSRVGAGGDSSRRESSRVPAGGRARSSALLSVPDSGGRQSSPLGASPDGSPVQIARALQLPPSASPIGNGRRHVRSLTTPGGGGSVHRAAILRAAQSAHKAGRAMSAEASPAPVVPRALDLTDVAVTPARHPPRSIDSSPITEGRSSRASTPLGAGSPPVPVFRIEVLSPAAAAPQ